ncbi:MAG: pentapeptide repeat-containing protein [Methanosarcinales archaeon]|nr:pentapeptide repeat-containing protein [Methanosarcinales archaeon]
MECGSIVRWIAVLALALLTACLAGADVSDNLSSNQSGVAPAGCPVGQAPGLNLSMPQDQEARAEATCLRIVQPGEIVGQVKAGYPVNYDRVYIAGDLDLSNLEKPVSEPIAITNSTVNGTISLAGSIFQEPVDLRGNIFAGRADLAAANFIGDCRFSSSRFMKVADFKLAKFAEIASFRNVNFSEVVDFSYAQFGKLATFEGASFWGDVSYLSAQFRGDTSFESAHFIKFVDFEFAQFAQLLSFWKAVFSSETSFANAQISGTSNFMNTRFEGNVTFMGARFGADVTFSRAQFDQAAIFGLANFNGFSDFSRVTFRGAAIFAVTKFADNARFVDSRFDQDLIMESARIYSLELGNATYGQESLLSLKGADFTRLIARWDTIKDHMVFDGAAYLALVKNYKNLEWMDDANECYYQYRKIAQSVKPWGFEKTVDIVSWVSCGYGVKPSFTILWSLFFIFLFGIWFWKGNGIRKFGEDDLQKIKAAESMSASQMAALHQAAAQGQTAGPKTASLIDSMYFSAMNFTAQAPANIYPVGHYRHLGMIEGMLGWFFLGLFVVVLSGTLIGVV